LADRNHEYHARLCDGEDEGDRIRIAVEQRPDILLQFLIESLVLSLIGEPGDYDRIAGTFVLASFTQWPILFSIEAILLAFLFSGSVGVFFGFYPARKASLLNPIEALHYE